MAKRHSTWLYVLVCLIAAIAAPLSALNAEVLPLVVRWDEPVLNEDNSCLKGNQTGCSNDLAGYRVYRAAGSLRRELGTPDLHAVVPAPATSFVDKSVVDGIYYRYYVTAVDSSGNESGTIKRIDSTALRIEGDQDQDGIINALDNCPLQANVEQTDTDGDGFGDACTGGSGNAGLPPISENACAADRDGDEVCDDQDNCPTVSNPDQSDINGDGVGDACAGLPPESGRMQYACARDSSQSSSSLALAAGSMIYLLDPLSGASAELTLPGQGEVVLGDLDTFTSGIGGFGNLEAARLRSADGEGQHLEIISGSETTEISLGAESGSLLSCHLDGDEIVDVASYTQRSVVGRFSGDLSEREFTFVKFGKVLHAGCGDTNGDGRDEIVILHKAAAGVKTSVIDLLNGKLLRSVPADPLAKRIVVADRAGNGKGVACTLAKIDKQKSALSCSAKGRKRLMVPAALDLSAGSYEGGSTKEQFALLSRGNKISIIRGNGKVISLPEAAGAALKTAGKSGKLRLISCR